MNAAVVLKALDLAILGLSAWSRYQETAGTRDVLVSEVALLRSKVLTGELTPDQVAKRIDLLIDQTIARRQKALADLPVPESDQ